MHRSLAAAVATFAAMAALSVGSTAAKASCEGQRAICLKACHRPGDLCNMHCNGPYQFCRYNRKEPLKAGGVGAKQNDARPKKGIDGTQPPLKWVPNSPSKAKGIPSVPASGTWNRSPSSGPTIRSSGGRR
jgi:hypothetical protein